MFIYVYVDIKHKHVLIYDTTLYVILLCSLERFMRYASLESGGAEFPWYDPPHDLRNSTATPFAPMPPPSKVR